MMFAVVFEDDEEKVAMRGKHMSEHLAFLEMNADRIRSAGPLQDADTKAAAGGLWFVEAADAKEVQGLVEADPFWPTGLRKSFRILEWRLVFSNGRRQT